MDLQNIIHYNNMYIANAIYDILVEHGKARNNERSSFIQKFLSDEASEWRFQEIFGFGGKY